MQILLFNFLHFFKTAVSPTSDYPMGYQKRLVICLEPFKLCLKYEYSIPMIIFHKILFLFKSKMIKNINMPEFNILVNTCSLDFQEVIQSDIQ